MDTIFGFDLTVLSPIKYAVPVYGYLSPVVICITAVTNILVLFVLCKKHMRSPTNTILAGIAISDMLLGLVLLPFFIYFFGLGHYEEYVLYQWCIGYFYVYMPFGEMFHTVSIWQTLLLTVQRYLLVHYTVQAKRWLSIPNIKRIIVVLYIIAMFAHAMNFFHVDIQPSTLPSKLHRNKIVIGCNLLYKSWYEENQKIYDSMYFWFRVIFINLIPCAILILLNSLLFSTLRSANYRRKQMMGAKTSDYSNRITFMLVIVVGLFILVEIPVAVDMIIVIIQFTWELQIYKGETNNIVPIMTNFFIFVNAPLNFFIYCGMSRKFRETFKSTFTCKPIPKPQMK